jgi:hypothetical protein
LIILRSGTKTAKSIKPTKVSNAATANNTRRNQTPDAAVLAAVGIKPEEFSDTLASCDSPLKILPLPRRYVSRFSASALASAAR